jgi:type IV pilus assembly protein PilC
MPEYIYRAVTSKGQIVRNRVEDVNRNTLIKKLKNNDLLPISIVQVGYRGKKTKANRRNMMDIDDIMKQADSANIMQGRATAKPSIKERINLALAREEKITTRDIIIFTQNFYLLKKANFNNIHALSTIIESTDNLSLRGILQDILAGVEAGEYMYTTMEYYSNIFPYIYTNMIKVGELSGSLTKSLEQAVKYLETSDTTASRLRKIIIPNAIQLLAIIALLIFGVAYIIPIIQDAFAESGTSQTLPGITLWFVDFCNALGRVWYIPVIIIAAVVGVVVLYINTPKGKYNFHYFKYKMPVFGKLIYAMDFARLMRAMLLNLENGMRIQEALEVSKAVVKNYVMLSIIETSINNILIGASWIEPFENSGLASSMQTEMLKIGMQTDIVEMMRKLVEYMEIDIENLMQKVMAVLPQIVYSIVGIFLIFLVIVIIVPCIQLYMGAWIFDSVDLTQYGM